MKSTTVAIPPAPALRPEEHTLTPPSDRHVWIAGYWTWRNDQYEWVAEHWELPPCAGAAWVAACWEQHDNSQKFHEGHWSLE